MDSELLLLKWNNQKNTVLGLVKLLRNKGSYSDATLACEGKFYQVHKIVLSVCSDYFAEIFEHASYKNPVIVLKDINYRSLEYLLDYMYLGEVNVKQSELSVLINAAECLHIKGLAAPDEHANNSERTKNKSSDCDEPAPKRKKKCYPKSSPTEQSCQPITSIFIEESLELDVKSEPAEEVNPEDSNILLEEENEAISISKEEIDYDSFQYHPGSSGLVNDTDENWEDYNIEGNDAPPADLDPIMSADPNMLATRNRNYEQLYASYTAVEGVRGTFKCKICNYATRKKYNFQRHIRLHTGLKPFSCQLCPYESADRSCLKKHVAGKHINMVTE